MALKNDRMIKALTRQPVDKTPIWVMRQAGRYLPEYREVRKQAGNFLTLCKTPELAAEVTLQPIERFDLDAAIIFSDILTLPDAMGLGLNLVEKIGPQFERPINTAADIEKLSIPDPQRELSYVMEAIRLVKQGLADRVPLIGFAGSPWTVATYMVEGGPTKSFSKIKSLLFNDPKALLSLLNILAKATLHYLNAQIEAGANIIKIFDTWGGILTRHHYQQFSLYFMQQIVDGLHKKYNGQTIPVILFTKGGGHWLKDIANTGCHAAGVDWTYDIDDAYQAVGDKVALEGNLDPTTLLGPKEIITQEAEKILQKMQGHNGHVFNLGHGILPETPPENLAHLIEVVHGFRKT